MKICFVSIFAYPLFNPDCDLNFGGSEVQISLLAKELALDSNFEVSLIVADSGQRDMSVIDGVTIYKSFQRGKGFLNTLLAPFKLYKTLKNINPDIVISRAAGVEAGVSAFYAKLHKKKYVYSLASNMDLDGSRFNGIRGKIFKYGLDSADVLVAQSDDQIKLINALYGEIKRSELIKNSFKIDSIGSSFKKNVLWVGRAVEVKMPESFLNLAESFPDESFVMIMQPGDKKIWEKIHDAAKKLDNLQLIEKVKFNEIHKYFNEAKVFVNTSGKEGFPNTFLQSACSGVPLLSLSVDPDKFIENNKVGLVCGNDLAVMEKNLKSMLENTKLYEDMSKNIINYVKENHDIKINIEKWKQLLHI